jgi:hypothetical protein
MKKQSETDGTKARAQGVDAIRACPDKVGDTEAGSD